MLIGAIKMFMARSPNIGELLPISADHDFIITATYAQRLLRFEAGGTRGCVDVF